MNTINNQPSIWTNVKTVVTGTANMLNHATSAGNELFQSIEEVARTGNVLAKANRQEIQVESEAQLKDTMNELEEKYNLGAISFDNNGEVVIASK